MRFVTRSGYVAANMIPTSPAVSPTIRVTRDAPAALITAKISSEKDSRNGRVPEGESESPVPLLSNRITRPRPVRCRVKRSSGGRSQRPSTLQNQWGMKTRSGGPWPTT